MKISDYLDASLIRVEDISNIGKEDIIIEMASLISTSDKIKSEKEFLEEIQRREEIETTGIGNAVAFPHARTDSVDSIVIAIARSKKGVNFRSIDGKPVHIIFMIGTPKKDINNYLKILAKLSKLMKLKENRDMILQASSAKEIIESFSNLEALV